MDSTQVFHVGVLRQYPTVSPLSLWERARVRGFALQRRQGPQIQNRPRRLPGRRTTFRLQTHCQRNRFTDQGFLRLVQLQAKAGRRGLGSDCSQASSATTVVPFIARVSGISRFIYAGRMKMDAPCRNMPADTRSNRQFHCPFNGWFSQRKRMSE